MLREEVDFFVLIWLNDDVDDVAAKNKSCVDWNLNIY